MFRKKLFGVLFTLCAGITTLAGSEFQVRFTQNNPFPDPKKMDRAWEFADTATALVLDGKNAVETFSTDCSMLFDNTNLYISMFARIRPNQYIASKAERAVNSMTLSLAPAGKDGDIYTFVIPMNGKFKAEKRAGNTVSSFGDAKVQVRNDWSYWRAMLTIPLASLGVKVAESENAAISFNFSRHNVDVPLTSGEKSSFAQEDPALWQKAMLTRNAGKPAFVSGAAQRSAELIPNNSFDIAHKGIVSGWYFVNKKDVAYKSVTDKQGQKRNVMNCFGKSYQAFTAAPIMTEGKTYILRVTARKSGNGGAFGIIALLYDPASKTQTQGKTIAWKTPLTDEFKNYEFEYKAEKGAKYFSFYRFGAEGSCVEYDSVSLIEKK